MVISDIRFGRDLGGAIFFIIDIVDDLKRSRSPLGPHRSKLVIICLTFQLLLDLWWSGWKGIRGGRVSEKGSGEGD